MTQNKTKYRKYLTDASLSVPKATAWRHRKTVAATSFRDEAVSNVLPGKNAISNQSERQKKVHREENCNNKTYRLSNHDHQCMNNTL